MKCNIHLGTWLDQLDGRKRPLRETKLLLDLGELDPNKLISQDAITVLFDYPLDRAVIFECPGPVTVKDLITFVARTYEHIYKEEDRSASAPAGQAAPGLLNRGTTDGRYGIWGHSLGDLFLEGFELGEDGVWDLHIGS